MSHGRLGSRRTKVLLAAWPWSRSLTSSASLFAPQTNEWNKNDDRLLQAVEHGDAEKVASLLGKKGASATKHDSEGKTA